MPRRFDLVVQSSEIWNANGSSARSWASGRRSEFGTVAFAADVQQHELLQPIRVRLLKYLANQLARLCVREMSLVAEDAANQPRRPATLLQEVRIVIELQRE